MFAEVNVQCEKMKAVLIAKNVDYATAGAIPVAEATPVTFQGGISDYATAEALPVAKAAPVKFQDEISALFKIKDIDFDLIKTTLAHVENFQALVRDKLYKPFIEYTY